MLGRPGISWRTVLAVSLTASVFPCMVQAGPWSVGAGLGAVSGYEPSEGADEFSPDWLLFASASRGLNRTLWLRSEVAYFSYSESHRGVDHQLPFGAPEATFVPVAMGLRWQAVPGGSGISPYFEFMPTAFAVRWEQQGAGSFTATVFGFTTGAGIHFHGNESWSLTYGLQLRHSAEIQSEWLGGAPYGLGSLTNLSFAVGLSWRSAPQP